MSRLGWELFALWSLAIILAAGAVLVVWLTHNSEIKADIAGIVINGFMLSLAQCMNAIRGLGTSRAMQSMVDMLGSSTPVVKPFE